MLSKRKKYSKFVNYNFKPAVSEEKLEENKIQIQKTKHPVRQVQKSYSQYQGYKRNSQAYELKQ